MQRRDLLRLLGGVSVLGGLAPAELFAVGRETHRRIELERSPLGFFDTHQMHTVAAAGERILPATDTPGAMAARCHRFTELIVADRYDLPRQRRFVSGLIDLDRRASSSTGHLFIDCAAPAQDATLGALEADAYDAAGAMKPDTFWRDLKYLTLFGYYTSEIGIEQELKTVRFPGRFDGCAPIAPAPR
ncbi:MAG: gluconate 2-dehydrogenase subunit 3 family protein [Gemmatimonadetes bacterium]|nr:gluconate 2-dehydrogenase subunit 3 family protein [Gemmatimonadota bacterium]MCA9763244.1 gluconate 2-dehydrogenase subunit 3 family protein [Gemmatimonadota bacterium]HPF61586.1 gluconate 2-dehydrogenase subunit 3 family protein [Gemmatimonadales bacterium]HRX17707.1 gluconate 2-dehydrogenase subunit 3 family protein [Gemmatimonadales bacterium]